MKHVRKRCGGIAPCRQTLPPPAVASVISYHSAQQTRSIYTAHFSRQLQSTQNAQTSGIGKFKVRKTPKRPLSANSKYAKRPNTRYRQNLRKRNRHSGRLRGLKKKAAVEIRTRDLFLTKEVLYLLSYSSGASARKQQAKKIPTRFRGGGIVSLDGFPGAVSMFFSLFLAAVPQDGNSPTRRKEKH